MRVVSIIGMKTISIIGIIIFSIAAIFSYTFHNDTKAMFSSDSGEIESIGNILMEISGLCLFATFVFAFGIYYSIRGVSYCSKNNKRNKNLEKIGTDITELLELRKKELLSENDFTGRLLQLKFKLEEID